MSGHFLKDYMVKLAGSSVGAFGTGSTLPWNQSQFLVSSPGHLVLAATGEGAEGSVGVIFYRDTRTGESAISSFPGERLLGHVLLAELPDSAVSEALESLAEIWEYHTPATIDAAYHSAEHIGGGRIVAEHRAEPILIAEG